jgi:hypothetical protein
MPELMLRYRSAAFFARLYAPDITLGMQTAEEVEDIAPERNVTPARVPEVKGLFASLPPSDDPGWSALRQLGEKLDAAGIDREAATEYLRSQAVTESTEFPNITPEEATAALTGFSHLTAALAPVAP